MNLYKLLIAFVVASLAFTVKAEPLQYYGTPIFYGKYTSEYYRCYYDDTTKIGECDDNYGTEEAIVGYTNPMGDTDGVGYTVSLFIEVVCSEGKCYSHYGEPFGEITNKEVSYWYLPKGYYLNDGPLGYVVFKHGMGPLAEEYPIKGVMTLHQFKDAPKGVVVTNTSGYDIYCNNSGECSYLNLELSHSELVGIIPKVLTTSCDQYFCYNPDQSIAGLNPRT